MLTNAKRQQILNKVASRENYLIDGLIRVAPHEPILRRNHATLAKLAKELGLIKPFKLPNNWSKLSPLKRRDAWNEFLEWVWFCGLEEYLRVEDEAWDCVEAYWLA